MEVPLLFRKIVIRKSLQVGAKVFRLSGRIIVWLPKNIFVPEFNRNQKSLHQKLYRLISNKAIVVNYPDERLRFSAQYSAFSTDCPAAPRMVLCPKIFILIPFSKALSSLILPTVIENPSPAILSNLG